MASVTPQRRRRGDDDDGGNEEDEISIDGESRASSTPNKRVRLSDANDAGDSNDEADASLSNPAVLPDSFRRSPQERDKQRLPPRTRREVRKHQPGSIVRLRLTNFVTYTAAEFHPGPSLNMIIGPNGTGKSTLVCAIALGLGAPPSVLGRAKDVGEFVRHGCKVAETEIELAGNPDRHGGRNQVVGARFTREGNKVEFSLNGRKTTKKEVQKLLAEFSIQVQNLCQFLPQDRVVEFAALNPVELLVQTQQAAAAPQVSEWHEDLKGMRREQKAKQGQQQTLLENLKHMEQRQNLAEGDVQRLRERAEFQQRIEALEKLRPFPEYQVAKRKNGEARRRMKEAERDLTLLRAQVEPNLQAERAKKEYLDQVELVAKKRETQVEKMQKTAATAKHNMEAAEDAIKLNAKLLEDEKDTVKKTKQKIPDLQRSLRQIQNAMENPPAEVDLAEMNERTRQLIMQKREVQEEISALKSEAGSLEQQITVQDEIFQRAEQEKQHSQTQAGQLATKLRAISQPAHQAWEWIQANRHRFESEVYGPPVIECSVPDARHAAAIESAIGADATAFTVTSHEDFKMLNRQLYTQMRLPNISIRASHHPTSHFTDHPPCPKERLREYGFQTYLIDLIEGPDAVLGMLCDNRGLHSVAYTPGNLSVQQTNALKHPSSPINSWVTNTETYSIARRREYGDKATSTRTTALKPARNFKDSAAGGGQPQQDEDLERRMHSAARAKQDFRTQHDALLAKLRGELQPRLEDHERNELALREAKMTAQRAQSAFAGLPAKLQNAQQKHTDALTQIRDSWTRQFRFLTARDAATLQKGQRALDYATQVSTLRTLHLQYLEAAITAIEARSDHASLQARTVDQRARLATCEQELRTLTREKQALLARAQELQGICEHIGADFDDYTTELYQSQVKTWEPEQLETELQSLAARLDLTGSGAGSARLLAEYEARAQDIVVQCARRDELDAALEAINERITEVRLQWEPEVDSVIARISEAFGDNFARIGCAGEVAVYKDEEDFENWAVQIKVKFRFVHPLFPVSACFAPRLTLFTQ